MSTASKQTTTQPQKILNSAEDRAKRAEAGRSGGIFQLTPAGPEYVWPIQPASSSNPNKMGGSLRKQVRGIETFAEKLGERIRSRDSSGEGQFRKDADVDAPNRINLLDPTDTGTKMPATLTEQPLDKKSPALGLVILGNMKPASPPRTPQLVPADKLFFREDGEETRSLCDLNLDLDHALSTLKNRGRMS